MEVLTTVLSLDSQHPVARAAMTDAHVAHRLTMSGFAHLLESHDFFTGIASGHADHRRSLNVLFAASARPNGALMFRIQSDRPPDFTHRACDFWRGAIDATTPPVTRLWPIPAAGAIRYQIRANASVSVDGRRRAVNGVRRQADWWLQRATSAGLRHVADTLTIDDPVVLQFPSKNPKRPSASAWIVPTVRYSGSAIIADTEAYRRAVTRGIGRGLSYGAGLLLTMPARQPESLR